jgi:hypothetical protein
MLPKMQVAPESLITAGRDLAAIGTSLKFAHLEAAAPTTDIASAASDEVSTAIAGVFASQGQDFQKLVGQATTFHDQFVQTLTGGANSYASAESANAAVLSAAPAETNVFDNPFTAAVWLGAVALSPVIVVALLGFLSTLLATYWAVTFLGTVFA